MAQHDTAELATDEALAPSNVVGLLSNSGPNGRTSDDVIGHLQKSQLYREYAEAFETTTGLPLALRRVGSLHSPLHGSKQASPFCAVMAARNKSCAACLRLQQQVEERAATSACTLECFAGLTESAVPIRVGTQVLGYLATGQVLQQPATEAGFVQVTARVKELGAEVDLPALKQAYLQTRVVPKTQYDGVVRLLDIFGQHLSAVSNQLVTRQASAESPVITRAKAFIMEHLDEDLTLAQVARSVCMSSYYFCKTFKKATGLTYIDYLSRVRIEKVKQLLLNPHTRISEAAFATGFQSLSQFNRTFRRIAGESPSRYRTRLHGPTLSHAA
jgi:AraC-like DNA-binding protein/ligand-binding sensor protein